MAERYFDRNEADELLPMIADAVTEAREQKRQMDGLDREFARAAAKIAVLGGWIPPHRELAEKRVLREQAREKVSAAVEQIQEAGCVLKDLEEGLVDFPTIREGQEAYLCWKLGEQRIGYWHSLEEGFAGRKPLTDAEPDEPSGPERVH
jgi:hypothetical protein